MRKRRYGDPLYVRKPIPRVPRLCSIDGCQNKFHAHGYCSKHSTQFIKHGDPLYVADPEQTRKKISEANMGRTAWNKGQRGVMPEPWNKGLTRKTDSRVNKIASMKEGIPRSSEVKQKLRNANLGKIPSLETRKKISKANMGRIVKTKTREKIGKKNKINSKNFWTNLTKDEKLERIKQPGFIKKGQKLALGIVQTDEHKRKNSEGHRYSIYPKEDTKPEKQLQKMLTDEKIKFEKHVSFKTSGRPWYHKVDLFIEPNICLEVYGDFIHANPNEKNADGSMKYPDDRVMRKPYKYSKEKTGGSIRAKDKRITKELEQQGNMVLIFWQSELEKNPDKCLQKILKVIKK
jgi:DNA mismatch endonuclease, patch repair protein